MNYDILQDDTILENDNIYVNTAMAPVWPGYRLNTGSTGSSVSIMQSYLNAIKNGIFPSLNRLVIDGVYGISTRNTVMQYQGLSGLTVDGIIGKNTWNAIIEDYNSLADTPDDEYPGRVLRPGMAGIDVGNLQVKLNKITHIYSAINYQTVDGIYGNNMSSAVTRFQQQFGLKADGLVGPATWNKITEVYKGILQDRNTKVSTNYPGYILNTGSSGNSVRFVQSYLNYINNRFSYNWPVLTVDSKYGRVTKQVVAAFQAKYGLKADGIVGHQTWAKIITELNNIL